MAKNGPDRPPNGASLIALLLGKPALLTPWERRALEVTARGGGPVPPDVAAMALRLARRIGPAALAYQAEGKGGAHG